MNKTRSVNFVKNDVMMLKIMKDLTEEKEDRVAQFWPSGYCGSRVGFWSTTSLLCPSCSVSSKFCGLRLSVGPTGL